MATYDGLVPGQALQPFLALVMDNNARAARPENPVSWAIPVSCTLRDDARPKRPPAITVLVVFQQWGLECMGPRENMSCFFFFSAEAFGI